MASVDNQRRTGSLGSANLPGTHGRCATGAQIVIDLSVRKDQQQLLANRLGDPALWAVERRCTKRFELVHSLDTWTD